LKLAGVAFVLLFIWTAFNPFADHLAMGLFTMTCWGLAFLLFDFRGGRRELDETAPWADWLLVIATVAVCVYYMARYEEMIANLGNLTVFDRIAAYAAILLALEASRRTIGLAVSTVAAALLVYCLYTGFSLDQVITRSLLGDVGIFGSVADIFARYILLFIVFGALLEQGGATPLLNGFVSTAAKKTTGGAAKAAVVGSAVMGGIVGSSSANVAVTGVVTIPVMIRQGYKPHRAAAIETAAGLGGEISPPVMGAAAFLVVANVGIQYRDLMLIAILPAVIYYLSIYFSIHLEAQRDRKHLAAMAERADAAPEAISDYLHILLPPLVLVAVVLYGYSPTYAGAAGIIAAIVVSGMRKKTRMSPGRLFDALAQGAFSFIPLGATAGALGLIMVTTIMSGVSNEFANWAAALSGSSLPLLLIAVFVLSLALGLGLPIVASYMILATVCGPGLQSYGVPAIAAHMLMLWFVQTAAITPPSALAAQISASIAGTGFYKTCWASMWLCVPFYIVPLWFIYTSLVTGTWSQRLVEGAILASGFFFLAVASVNYLRGRLAMWESALAWCAAILLLVPFRGANIAGGVVGVFVYCYRWITQRKATT